MEKKRQIISLVIVVSLLLGAGALLWWGNRPVVSDDAPIMTAAKKDAKDSTSLFSDPRFQALRSRSGDVTVGTKGNANPFEPFSRQ